jgi:hypothetical protein
MSKIVLINGYATNLTCPRISYKIGTNCGFDAFEELIKNGNAKTFRWGKTLECNVLEYLSPIFQWKLFLEEKQLAKNKEQLSQLHTFLVQNKPTTIVCHSLGTELFFNFSNQFELPKSINKVIFVQGALQMSLIQNQESQFWSQIKNNKIELTNCYCPYDNALVSHFFLSKFKNTIGTQSVRSILVKNKLFPLYKKFNLHTSSICDLDILKIL